MEVIASEVVSAPLIASRSSKGWWSAAPGWRTATAPLTGGEVVPPIHAVDFPFTPSELYHPDSFGVTGIHTPTSSPASAATPHHPGTGPRR